MKHVRSQSQSLLLKAPARQRGFTLVELIVSLGLFTIVVVAVVSSLYTVNAAYRRVSAMREVLDNLNFAIESVVRNVHTGTDIYCGQRPGTSDGSDCSIVGGAGNSTISLKSTLGGTEAIQYSLKVAGTDSYIERTTASINSETGTVGGFTNPVRLTAPQIKIQNLTFYVEGAAAGDGQQPRVIMFLQGIAKADEQNMQPFAVQTYISQRSFE